MHLTNIGVCVCVCVVSDPNMTTIKVWIDAEQGSIRILNDGQGIPVHVHKQEGLYLPELLFGHLLTGSNFDDSVAKVTGGRNGECNLPP